MLNYKKKIIAIIIDEGLAIYFRSNDRWVAEAKRNGASVVQLLKIYIRDYIFLKILKQFLCLNGRLINCNLLVNVTKGGVIASEKMVGYYKEVIKKALRSLILNWRRFKRTIFLLIHNH